MKHIDLTYHSVPRETFLAVDELMKKHREQLSLYLDQLLWWNERINLVSRNATPELVREHIRHSLLISSSPLFTEASRIVDAGTGGGLPGIPLAICHPEKGFLLNDIVSKKVLSVKQMVRKLNLENVLASDGSVETIALEQPSLLISKHAFKIDRMLHLIEPLPWTRLIFYKGAEFLEELKDITTFLDVDVYRFSQGTDLPFYEGKVLVAMQRKGVE